MRISRLLSQVALVAGGFTAGAAIVASGALFPAAARDLAMVVPFAFASPTSTPLLTEANPGSGPGILSSSAGGDGLVGQTTVASTTKVSGAGLAGFDLSTKGKYDSGVLGTSSLGSGVFGKSVSSFGVEGTSTKNYGVLGISTGLTGVYGETFNPSKTSGTTGSGVTGYDESTDGGKLNYGVYGYSLNGTGVTGTSGNGSGVSGYSTSAAAYAAVYGSAASGPGTYGASATNDGAYATTFNPSASDKYGSAGVTGIDESTDSGHLDSGLFGLSSNGTGIVGVGGVPIAVQASSSASVTLFEAFNSSGTLEANLDTGGNLHLTGDVFTAGSCHAGCARTYSDTGSEVTAYAERSSVPSIEDYGEAQLQNGYAFVSIAPDFAHTMDRSTRYLVFITPEGDSRGLYVTSKTAEGFVVRENGGGRSDLAFQYRIVAKPFGANLARLPQWRGTPLASAYGAPLAHRMAPTPSAPHGGM